MKKGFVFAFVLFSAAQALCMTPVAADDDSGKVIQKRVNADTPSAFAEVAAAVRNEMGTGGRYEFISPDEKAKANADLDAMAGMLQKYGSVAAMRQDERVVLFNTQEHLNGVLTHSDRNRLVCEHRPPMGSNIAVTSCKTVAELEKMRRDGQKMAMDGSGIGWTCRSMKAGTGCAAGQKMGN
jgi:hypothetical protein